MAVALGRPRPGARARARAQSHWQSESVAPAALPGPGRRASGLRGSHCQPLRPAGGRASDWYHRCRLGHSHRCRLGHRVFAVPARAEGRGTARRRGPGTVTAASGRRRLALARWWHRRRAGQCHGDPPRRRGRRDPGGRVTSRGPATVTVTACRDRARVPGVAVPGTVTP